MMAESWTNTSGAIARAAGVTVPTVTKYANLELIPSRRSSNGTRLFPDDAAETVREVYRERMARRGRKFS